jgi:tetratricopeptide (TPR) repeat protein
VERSPQRVGAALGAIAWGAITWGAIKWIAITWVAGCGVLCPLLCAQEPALGAPAIAAHVKGPDQINLTWPAVADPGYGYLVEIQSAGDSRFSAWTELEPIPRAGGYTCDSSIVSRGARCNLSDPTGVQVHNPPNRGIPYWVTEATYIDPQDGTAAQFIAWGLKPHTTYSFRARSYSGNDSPVFSAYSNTASGRTSDYTVRYVSPEGKDANDGKGEDRAHAWRTLTHGAGSVGCGQVLVVMGGNYATDEIRMTQKCSAAAKAVVLVNPGDTATLTSQPANSGHAVVLAGDYLVIDGLGVASGGTPYGEYDAEIGGSHNALLNVEFRPPAIPSFKFGVAIYGQHNLIYRSYLHDYGSPDATQNPDGGGGFLLALLGWGATGNAIWSNHLTRGGHDESLCKSGCRNNRWLNNVMDGGWGQGWIAVYGNGPSDHNLVEGNFIKGIGQISQAYKPAIQVSGANNTVRRNVVVGTRSWALEVSSFGGGTASYNLIYNNVFYDSGGCYFQSSSRGIRAYDNAIYANNICYKVRDVAFRIYLGNTTNRNTNNDTLSVDAAGKPQPERAFLIWNQLGGGTYESAKSVAVADRSYDPVFSRNKAVSLVPRFVDEANLDFHLSAGSPLLDAGLAIADAEWGGTAGAADLGAFGIGASDSASGPAGTGADLAMTDTAMERARAGDFEAAVKAVRARATMPHALAMEAALLRAAFDDAGAAAVLARMGSPSAGDLVARYERVRQGTGDPALWDLLAANPERLLEMADTYIQWGLLRDALALIAHRYPQPVPALSNGLMLYYRSYCRDRLDYTYYAGEDLRLAGTLPLKVLSPRFPGALQVFQLAVQRNPTDANAHLLLALAHQNAGRVSDAREAARNALKLRPGFPGAEALLAELGPGPVQVHKLRPAGSGPAFGATDPATAAAPAASSRRETAAMALRIAASGDIEGAMSYFTPAKFPQAQQEDAVREAYIELRLRRVVAMAAARQCAAATQGLSNLEAEDKSLPFTFKGFGSFTKGVRFQYWLGVVEFACVDENAARQRWEKLSKATPEIASTDHAYPYMALAKLDLADGKTQARKALGFLQRQLGTAAPEYQGALLYSQGLLQSVAGRKDDAAASFRAGAAAGPPGMVEYLNLDAARSLDAGQ